MRKLTIVAVIAVTALLTSSANAVITGTAHDFNGKYGLTEICKACHVPHGAYAAGTGAAPYPAPLWNHQATAVTTYTLYTSPTGTMQAVPTQPGGASKACMSCHDGTVAVDAIGTSTGTATNKIAPTNANYLGTDLSNDHPVSFTYDTALATTDGNLSDPATKTVTTIKGTGTIATKMLFAGKVECASCHDVHGGQAGTHMLVMSNVGSAMCLACHLK